jgi:ABC-type branched-subunit amino acid transport system ATPase component
VSRRGQGAERGAGGAPLRLLQVRGVTKRFGGLTAVDDVSFDVFPGTIKALIGPNGAGKSTLFNVLTGFERPDAGSVLFEDEEIVGRRPRAVVRAGLARTFQNTQLFDELSAAENVMVGRQAHQGGGFASPMLRLPGATGEDREAREEAGRLLRLIGIEEWVDVPAADLPAGIRRLVEIARALATRPRLLLLDEPAAGLSSGETRELVHTLRRVRDAGVTVVVVEHDMGLVMDVSDEIVVLDRGRKIAEGPPRMIQLDPVVIAAYLGGDEDEQDDVADAPGAQAAEDGDDA